jgi:hypothetical protein
VRTICSCKAGGVLSIRRTIEGGPGQDVLALGRAQRRPALVLEDHKARHLGQHQGEQQERDQLTGEAPRPEPPQGFRQARHARRTSAVSM